VTALEGVRVVDFGRYVAGPYCACLLGDMGADVIRVERVQGGEDRFVVPAAADGSGILFLQVNRNKRGITLDPMAPEGREVLSRLVASADVVVANLPGATLAAMGLDYDSVRAVRPDIVLTTVSAFGSGGPYSERLGFDGVGQSFSGSVYLSGEPGTPSKAYVPWVDYTSAALAAMGTLAALLWRERTGEGQHVEGALIKSALAVAGGVVVEQAVLAPDRVPTGNRSQIAGPSDIFATRDGWIIVQVIGQPLFRRWADLMGEDGWLTDPRFADDDSRGRHGEVLSDRMAAWCALRTTADALGELEVARIPAGPVLSPQRVLDDPHVRAIDFLQPTDYPGLPRPPPLPRMPVDLSASPASVRHRAPLLGEHTDLVLADLGYSQADVAELRRAGVV
jgi:crotonobetainyl-CoA:carnitine CoA-transferase CaiB-like acyl-CoA transferase